MPRSAARTQSVDYPARGILGVDYHLSSDTTLFAEYEHADGDQLKADTTRFGVRTRPWERTQVESSINTQATEYGPRTFANFGLTQGFVWQGALGVRRGRRPEQHAARSGSRAAESRTRRWLRARLTEDFFAAFVGASYRHELWQMTSRLEHRNSDTEDRWSSTTGWYREPVEGHAMSVSLQAFDQRRRRRASRREAVGRFAWAFRPDSSRWIVFDRLELKYDDQIGAGACSFESSRVVNNLHANWQLEPVAAARPAVRRALRGEHLRRRPVRRRLRHRRHRPAPPADAPLRPRCCTLAALHSWESDVMDYSTGLDVGMTFAKNVWVSVGYNFAGFRDDDFSASRHTAQGPYLQIRIKADQDTFKDLNLDSLRASR